MRRSLGDGVRVHAWSLAEYFLLAWEDWHGLLGRYLRYFGRATEELPARWQGLAAQCEDLGARMFHDPALSEVIAGAWKVLLTDARSPGQNGQAASLETICQEIVLNHRRLALLLDRPQSGERVLDEPMPARPGGDGWSRCLEVIRRLNSTLLGGWRELSRPDREEGIWQFRHYRRANLLASWLLAGGPFDGERSLSPLLQILSSETPMVSWIDKTAALLQTEGADSPTVHAVLGRIAAAVGDFSYDDFVQDVCAGTFHGGADSPLGTDAINLIPSKNRDTPRAILLAVSRGDKKALGFTTIMRQVREHLIDFQDTTRIVIVLCDQWTKTTLEEHRRDLRAHYRRGVRFVFLLAGSPGTVLAPLPVDLLQAP